MNRAAFACGLIPASITATRSRNRAASRHAVWGPLPQVDDPRLQTAANGTKRTCPVLSSGKAVASIRDTNGTRSRIAAGWFTVRIQRGQVIDVQNYVQTGRQPPPNRDKRDTNGKNKKFPAAKTGQGHGPLYIRGPSVPFRPGAFPEGSIPPSAAPCLPCSLPRWWRTAWRAGWYGWLDLVHAGVTNPTLAITNQRGRRLAPVALLNCRSSHDSTLVKPV